VVRPDRSFEAESADHRKDGRYPHHERN
jgi:hypothetical protein